MIMVLHAVYVLGPIRLGPIVLASTVSDVVWHSFAEVRDCSVNFFAMSIDLEVVMLQLGIVIILCERA
jgi:hypothetical protein